MKFILVTNKLLFLFKKINEVIRCVSKIVERSACYCIVHGKSFSSVYFDTIYPITLFWRMCIECITNRNCHNEINIVTWCIKYLFICFFPFISYPVLPQTKASKGRESPFDMTSKSRGFGSSQKWTAKCLGAKYRTVTILYSFSIAKRSFFNMSGSKFNQ